MCIAVAILARLSAHEIAIVRRGGCKRSYDNETTDRHHTPRHSGGAIDHSGGLADPLRNRRWRPSVREQVHVGNAEGETVTCHYIHATGTYEVIDFTTDPDAVPCARFLSLRSPPPVTEGRWAAPLPTDRMVQLECRFIRYPVEGDGGLGTRFTAEAPLRLAVNFSAGQLDPVTADDRSALGDPKQDMPSTPPSP